MHQKELLMSEPIKIQERQLAARQRRPSIASPTAFFQGWLTAILHSSPSSSRVTCTHHVRHHVLHSLAMYHVCCPSQPVYLHYSFEYRQSFPWLHQANLYFASSCQTKDEQACQISEALCKISQCSFLPAQRHTSLRDRQCGS